VGEHWCKHGLPLSNCGLGCSPAAAPSPGYIPRRTDTPESRAYWETIDRAAEFTRKVAAAVEGAAPSSSEGGERHGPSGDALTGDAPDGKAVLDMLRKRVAYLDGVTVADEDQGALLFGKGLTLGYDQARALLAAWDAAERRIRELEAEVARARG